MGNTRLELGECDTGACVALGNTRLELAECDTGDCVALGNTRLESDGACVALGNTQLELGFNLVLRYSSVALYSELGFTYSQERCGEVYTLSAPSPPLKSSYTVHTDIKVIQSYLTVPEFELGACADNADILWSSEHFKQFQ